MDMSKGEKYYMKDDVKVFEKRLRKTTISYGKKRMEELILINRLT